MANVSTKHSAIFNFWKDKQISRHGEVKQIDGVVNNGFIPVVDDWLEPKCWGCGKPVNIDFDCSTTEKAWDSCKVREKLQRCHILPGSCGGADEPCNLFLLCGQCHVASPDTTNKSAFFRWVFRERALKDNGWPILPDFMKKIEEEISDRGGLSLHTMMEDIDGSGLLDDQFNYANFYEWAKKNSTTHCHHLSESTMVVLWADYIECVYNQLVGAAKAE